MNLFSKIIAALTAFLTLLSSVIPHRLEPFEPAEIVPPQQEEVEMMTLVENGASGYVIVLAADASPAERTAAEKLRSYLAQISGVQLEVVTDEAQPAQEEILLGKTNREGSAYELDRTGMGDEDVKIFAAGKRLVITGGSKRGTLYGVYSFLEKCLGCRWYTAALTVVPESATVKIPAGLNITEKPQLEYRETDWISPKTLEYSLANKLNSNIYRRLSPENGGYMGYTGSGFAHTLTTYFVKANTYFETHPEYYAYREDVGQRVNQQLCLTNPEVRRICVEEVLNEIRKYPDAQIVSLTQHDNQTYCQCKNCAAVDEAEGSHAGTMIQFINYVADAVKQAGYTDVAIDTFAYQYTRKAPTVTVPRDNVIVRLCSIECCFAHALNDPGCAQNADFCNDLENWAKISNRLYVWDYTTNYANYLGPFPDFHVIQQNLQFFVEHSVVGVYEEGNYTASQCNAEFAELRAYLLSKLMWDPYIDLDAETNGFMQAYYGEGWQYIKEYNRMTCANTGTLGRHMTIYQRMTDKAVLSLDCYEIEYIDDLWSKAKELASGDELDNVCRSELSWRYWKACNKTAEFSRLQKRSNWIAEHEKLFADYQKYGIVRLREGQLLSKEPDFTLIPSDWNGDRG